MISGFIVRDGGSRTPRAPRQTAKSPIARRLGAGAYS
jgi:hypothetical protein